MVFFRVFRTFRGSSLLLVVAPATPCLRGESLLPQETSESKNRRLLVNLREQAASVLGRSADIMCIPLQHCGGVRAGTGRRLLPAASQVRFLPPQLRPLDTRRPRRSSRVGWALASPGGCNPSVSDCGGSTPSRRTRTARSSNGSGYETLNLVMRVRLPHGLLGRPAWATRRVANGAKNLRRKGHGR
jgi:hypothetical protein